MNRAKGKFVNLKKLILAILGFVIWSQIFFNGTIEFILVGILSLIFTAGTPLFLPIYSYYLLITSILIWVLTGKNTKKFAILYLSNLVIFTSVLMLGLNIYRDSAIRRLEPDKIIVTPIIKVFRIEERWHLNFLLHAKALKFCVPMAYSYRLNGVYILENNVAVNVLPDEWLDECSIVKSEG